MQWLVGVFVEQPDNEICIVKIYITFTADYGDYRLERGVMIMVILPECRMTT